MKQRPDKLASLLQQSNKGRQLADFAHDAFVNEYFDGLEARLVNDMAAGASILAADHLRALAVSLKTVRDLRSFIKTSAADGARAEKQYSEMVGT